MRDHKEMFVVTLWVLKQHGLRVGLMGVPKADLDKLGRGEDEVAEVFE